MLGISTLDNCFLIPVRINSVFSSFIRSASYHLVFSTHHSMVVMTSVCLLSHRGMTSLCVFLLSSNLQTHKEKGSKRNPEMWQCLAENTRHSTVEWRRPSTYSYLSLKYGRFLQAWSFGLSREITLLSLGLFQTSNFSCAESEAN